MSLMQLRLVEIRRDYGDHIPVGQVVATGESPEAIVQLYEWERWGEEGENKEWTAETDGQLFAALSEGGRKAISVDRITGCQITHEHDGSIVFKGLSTHLRDIVGVRTEEDAEVMVKVTPISREQAEAHAR